MSEKRLIDANALRNELYEADAITMKGVAIINQFPTVDAVEVVYGHWNAIGRNYCTEVYRCSECDAKYDFRSPYCPNCGAKMDGERRDDWRG